MSSTGFSSICVEPEILRPYNTRRLWGPAAFGGTDVRAGAGDLERRLPLIIVGLQTITSLVVAVFEPAPLAFFGTFVLMQAMYVVGPLVFAGGNR